MRSWHDSRGTDIPWSSLVVCVAGAGVSGRAAATVLERLGAQVDLVDAKLGPEELRARCDLVVTSPGWRPTHPMLRAAAERGVPVWGEVELAARFASQPWLGVTGTNGKTTTTEMLAAMLAADGRDVVAAGNIGTPLIEVVTADRPPQVIAVELSSFQLHWTHTLRLAGAAVLNVAPDHLDWHGGFAAYAADKRRAYEAVGADGCAVVNADDPQVVELAQDISAGRIDFTVGEPANGSVGVRDGVIVDQTGAEVLPMNELAVRGQHNLANALAATALARGHGATARACATALRSFAAGPHRLELVATIAGVDYVNDSKATNPHAAARALASFGRVVWVAGGLNKGLAFDDLVAGARDHLVAAVLIGSCAGEIAAALATHAPEVPVFRAADLHTAVETARDQARAGDTVLLAPAAASMDMFTDYAERGRMFAAAVHELEDK